MGFNLLAEIMLKSMLIERLPRRMGSPLTTDT